MLTFVARRAAAGVVLILAVSFLAFALIYSGGSDIARNILGPEANQAQVDAKAIELGLDRPFLVQYWDWLTTALSGSLGKSWFSTEMVGAAISSRFVVTFSIVIVAVVVVTILSVVLGVAAAVLGGWMDRLIQIISVLGVALPNFWFALVLVRFFAIDNSIFPATGFVLPSTSLSGWANTIILPVIALVIGGMAAAAQQIRSAVVDVLRQDYIRTLRARGLSSRSVLFKHALRNASPPALTVLSLQFIGMMGGAVVIEKVFAIQGLGMLGLNATLRGDIPVIMGVVMTMAVIVVVVNFLIDLANGWANPEGENLMTDIISPLTADQAPTAPRVGVLRKILRDPMGLIPLIIILLFIVISVFANVLAPFKADFVRLDLVNEPPFQSDFILGGDTSGRDVLSRLLIAGQLSILGAAVTVVVSVTIGVITGLLAGYFGGIFDGIVSWLANVVLVLPSKIVLVALFAVIGPNTLMTMTVLGVMLFPGFFRLVRNLVIGVKQELFVDAARVSGLSDARIIGRHILGAVRAPIVIQAAFTAGIAVVIQAGLEFIGLGDPSTPTWGGMLEEAFKGIYTAPSLLIWPGVTVGLFVASFVLLGNSLRDALEGGVTTKKRPARKQRSESVRSGKSSETVVTKTLSQEETENALLIVEGLNVAYPAGEDQLKRVVENISFTVKRGEVLGLVGESGSGKTQTAFSVLGLLPDEAIVSADRIEFDGLDLNNRTRATSAAVLGRRIAYIPQEPMSNLDPAYKIGYQLVEPMRALLGLSKTEARAKALDLLNQVGIVDPQRTFDSYPHQISGGMAQRVLIAGAISCDPDLIIADEPTTALDVTIQAEVLDILRTLQKDRDMAMILVTHNFGVVADLCDRVVVMQHGEFVERNDVEELFENPQHPYTQMLLNSTLDDGYARPALGTKTERRLVDGKVES